VVIVREEHGWFAWFCSDSQATVEQILEAVADRGTIEQVFHDVKEVQGAGQQQLRNIWANIGAWNLLSWWYTLIELWAWKRKSRNWSIAAPDHGMASRDARAIATSATPYGESACAKQFRSVCQSSRRHENSRHSCAG